MAVCPIRHIDPLVLHPRAIECVSQPLHHVNGHPSMHLPYEDSLKFDGIGTIDRSIHPSIECVSQPLHHVNCHPSMHLQYEESLMLGCIGTDLCEEMRAF